MRRDTFLVDSRQANAPGSPVQRLQECRVDGFLQAVGALKTLHFHPVHVQVRHAHAEQIIDRGLDSFCGGEGEVIAVKYRPIHHRPVEVKRPRFADQEDFRVLGQLSIDHCQMLPAAKAAGEKRTGLTEPGNGLAGRGMGVAVIQAVKLAEIDKDRRSENGKVSDPGRGACRSSGRRGR